MPETTQQDRIDRAAAHLRQVATMLQELDRNQGETRSNGFRWALNGVHGVASRLSTVGESEGLDVTSLDGMQRRADRVGTAFVATTEPSIGTHEPDDDGSQPGRAMAARSASSRHPRALTRRLGAAARAEASALPIGFDVYETDNGPGGMSWELHARDGDGTTVGGWHGTTVVGWLTSCRSEDEALRAAYRANDEQACRVAVWTFATWEAAVAGIEDGREGEVREPDRIVTVPR